ncbi:ArsR/SmtB family transcription factor [Haloglomus litoreum]|uniref:ArsR/SmtB family transcription factor n=1 Tax=Haloglomus litoreum TaxID=3034026 RepID=UPI0023E89D93|nr:metalloregulator ArsR/SmtB family transcription factor [Haloglomus sp. DT116]
MVSDPDSGTVDSRDARADSDAGGGCCSSVSHQLTDHEVELDVRTFSALANDTRYEALRLLAAADEEVCACDLEPELGVNQSSTSRALSALHQAGLVERRKEGRWRYYTTTPRAETLLTAVDTTRDDVL